MAVDLTLKSVAITNREAVPSVANNPGRGGSSKLKTVSSYLASVTAELSATSIIRMVEVPSNAVVKAVFFQSDPQGGSSDGCAFNIGVYRTIKDGGAVVDDDLFAAAKVVEDAAIARIDLVNQSTNNTIAKQNQPLWQAAGMTADPKSMLDIALTVSSDITTGTGAVGLEVRYSD